MLAEEIVESMTVSSPFEGLYALLFEDLFESLGILCIVSETAAHDFVVRGVHPQSVGFETGRTMLL